MYVCDFIFKFSAPITLASFFIDLLKAERCCLYYNGNDNANEATLLGIISKFSSFWMCFFICYKYVTVLMTFLNLLSSCRTADKFITKNCKWKWVGKLICQFDLKRGHLRVCYNLRLNSGGQYLAIIFFITNVKFLYKPNK